MRRALIFFVISETRDRTAHVDCSRRSWMGESVEGMGAPSLLDGGDRNVHPAASFEDLCYEDFVAVAGRIAPFLAMVPRLGVGRAVFSTVDVTRRSSASNVNLGIVLLLTPLAAVPQEKTLPEGIWDVLNGLTERDAQLVYEAIKVARPGGMGEVSKEDVSGTPHGTLLDVMKLAEKRDQVAAQYATGFRTILQDGVPFLEDCGGFPDRWDQAVIHLHLTLMTRYPDSLIARKCGMVIAQNAAELAQGVLDAGWPDTERGQQQLKYFDKWLRSDANRRNPGTTADLVTACLFAAMRDGHIQPPTLEQVQQQA